MTPECRKMQCFLSWLIKTLNDYQNIISDVSHDDNSFINYNSYSKKVYKQFWDKNIAVHCLLKWQNEEFPYREFSFYLYYMFIFKLQSYLQGLFNYVVENDIFPSAVVKVRTNSRRSQNCLYHIEIHVNFKIWESISYHECINYQIMKYHLNNHSLLI